ncbi:MFS transporter [Methanobacterium sp. ACI-7]|uniref:MFS transporter n=1 Tax=unclassified Methanobacterium TaxID=2627676 RepID=UPI0039C181AC
MILNRKLITFVLAMGMFLWSFSAGIVNISLPTISQYLDISTNLVSLVIISHLIVLTSFLLIFGRIGDIFGHKKVFLIGIFLFTVSSYFCAISLDIFQLIVFRLIQGLGSAMLLSMVPAIISTIFPHSKRGRIFGYISLTTTLGLASGYGIGGFIVENIGWNWIFIIVVPMGIATILLANKYLPSYSHEDSEISFDIVGSLLIFLATLMFILPFNVEKSFDIGIPIEIATFITSILLMLLLFIWESKYKDPLFDISIFKNLYITLSIIAAFLATLVLTGTIFLIPFYFELIMGYPSDFAGLIILIPSLTVIFIGPISGYISDKIGSRIPILIACITLITAVVLLYSLNETIGLAFIFIALGIRAISEGMFTPANNKLVMSHSPKEKIGSVASLLNSARYLGLVMGVVVFNSIFDYTISNEILQLTGIPTKGAFQLSAPIPILLDGFQSAFIVGIGLSVLILLFSFLSKENILIDDEEDMEITYYIEELN